MDVPGASWQDAPQELLRQQEQRTQFGEPDPAGFSVRGPSYLDDKVKIPSEGAGGTLLPVQLYIFPPGQGSNPKPGSGKFEPKFGHLLRCPSVLGLFRKYAREQCPEASEGGEEPFLFCVNFQIPGDPPYSIVACWAMPAAPCTGPSAGVSPDTHGKFRALFQQFVSPALGVPATGGGGASESGGGGVAEAEAEGDAFRNARFKLIPRITEGPWVVRKAVGTHPVLLGNKLKQAYYSSTEQRYVEITVNVASSSVAHKITTMCRDVSAGIVVDMAVTLQADEVSELPELLVGTVQLNHMDPMKHGLAVCVDDEAQGGADLVPISVWQDRAEWRSRGDPPGADGPRGEDQKHKLVQYLLEDHPPSPPATKAPTPPAAATPTQDLI
jgi:hypothetical protein